MNFFKKALIATAVVGTFGVAQAADLTNAVKDHSVQGLEVATNADTSSVRVIVRELMEAGDKITLVFGKGVGTDITGAIFGSAAVPTAGNAGIKYGTGTFGLGFVSASTTSDVTTLVIEVLTGDPIPKDGSFEVAILGADFDKAKTAEATVTYSAVSGITGNAKDTTGNNVGKLLTTANQYSATVKTTLDGVIERASQVTFVSGASDTAKEEDTLVINITDNQTLLTPANGTNVQAKVTVFGDFSGASFTSAMTTTSGDTVSAVSIATDKKSMTFTVDDIAAAGIAGTYTATLDNASGVIKASKFTATVAIDASKAVTTNTVFNALDKADAGEWKVDATIINIPYMPVGYEGTSTSVHFSNLGPKADVIVEAVSVIDADGKSVTYKATDLGFDLAANSVTKVSQTAIMSALSIPAGSHKLSVTFNIDGKSSDVSAYAYTSSAVGRAEVSNSQQK